MIKLTISVIPELEDKRYYFIVKQLNGPFEYDSSVDRYYYHTREECNISAINKKKEIKEMLNSK